MLKKSVKRLTMTALIVWGLAMSFFCVARAEESVQWTPEDFVYSEMEQTLNGCDYTRQFVISGPVVSGFSESGEQKLETCKDLVLPSETEDGEKLVGVADGAFSNKGLTSVTFPEGMMVDYDDTVTHVVTKRGNYIIGAGAFSKNNLTELDLPEGVIAVMSTAFKHNQLTSVALPHTIWWIENSSFCNNELETVGFPKTCDFQVQIHAFAFSYNKIKAVTLPYYAEVVDKRSFYFNPGMEECGDDTPEKEKGFGGIVYMYSTNKNLANMERIHHYGRTAESQHSWHQKLFIGEKPAEGNEWTKSDFTYDGTKITGLSSDGVLKRKENPDLVLPDTNPDGKYITEIAASNNAAGGLFAAAEEKFRSVDLPMKLEVIGKNAFADAGLSRVKGFPVTLKSIGESAFRQNKLPSVVLPDTVTTLDAGAFATNPKLRAVLLSKGLTEISSAAFGCSDNKNYMTELTELTIPNTITKIGARGFAGSNIHNIVIPESVTEIGEYAFSTKNYLSEECTVTLPEGLKTIGKYAFRNKVIYKIEIPESVTSIGEHAFLKEYSDGSPAITTKVYVTQEQKDDTEHFAISQNAAYIVRGDTWNEYDFTYEATDAASVVTGLSESGEEKVKSSQDLVIPAVDPDGKPVTGVKEQAFASCGLQTVTLPDGLAEIGSQSFASNELLAVQLPASVDSVEKDAFLNNVGVSDGMVYMYASEEKAGILSSECQKLMAGQELPEEYEAWGKSDFTYSEDGASITGFSEIGARKVEIRSFVRFPKESTGKIPVTAIERQAFKNSKITQIQLPSGIQAIGESAFEGNNIKTLELPDSITSVGANAFASNQSLQKIVLSKNMKEIPEGFAKNASELTELEIPTGVKSIGNYAFYGNKLTKIVIPSGVETIGVSAFECQEKETTETLALEQTEENEVLLRSLTLGDGLKSIEARAFANTEVAEVDIPKTVTKLAADAFYNTKGIVVKVYVANESQLKDSSEFISKSDYHSTEYSSLACTGWTYSDFTFDGSIITGWSKQGNNTRLQNKKLVIPDKNPDTGEDITEIGDQAFQIPYEEVEQLKDSVNSPNGMVEITIPDTITKIGKNAFEYNALETVKLPSGLKSVGALAFHGNKLTEVSLPDSVTALEDGAFSMNNITSVKLSGGLKRLNSGIFSMNIRLEQVDIPEGVTEIGEMAFAGDRLTSLKIPSTVTKIERKAFHLHHIKELTVPGNVKEIGESAFEGTYKAITLEKLVLNEGIETIGSKAFRYGYLENVELPSSLKNLETDAFADNAGTANDHIVILYTANKEHLQFKTSDSYSIQYREKVPQNTNQSGNTSEIQAFKNTTMSGSAVSVNTSKKTLKISYKSVTGARSYLLEYRLNGKGSWKTVSVSVPSYTLKKLKKGTVAEIRIRGVRSDNRATVYTQYSQTERVLMNNCSLKSAKGAKKAITVKWSKQDKVNGYQICYSTNKQFSDGKTVSVKSKKATSKTIKVPKRKKIYYVKVRAYKKVSGKTYFSAWSKVKKVRSK